MSSSRKEKLSKNFWIILVCVCSIFIIVLAVGIVLVSNKKQDIVVEKKEGGNILLNYSDNIDGLSISNAIPTSDLIGIKDNTEGSYFDFSVDANLDEAKYVEYEVSIKRDKSKSTISDSDIRVYLEKESDGTYSKVFGPTTFEGLKKKTVLGSEKDSMVLTKAKKVKSGTDNYRLRIWLADTSLVQNGSYSVEVDINGKAK